MNNDPQALSTMIEESQDLHADVMRSSPASIREAIETDNERAAHGAVDHEANRVFADRHRRSVATGIAGTTILGAAGGAALVTLLASPAFASSSPDIQMLQTAASIENLAVSTYTTALTLPYVGGATANAVITKFCQVTVSQHKQHGAAFNAAVKRLGGSKQTKPDPAFVPVVNKAVAGLSSATPAQGALGVVALALELENIAAETYVSDVSNLKDTNAKALTASIMGVEAQHASVLLAVQALLQAGAPQLIVLSPNNVSQLPAAAGSVGFPNAFYPTDMAAAAKQGAVK
jgi:Ferritin-like domain